MNEDAFARRFYADRSELESLRIQLTVESARRRGRRAGELLAAPGELPPPRNRVHRQGARRAADRAEPARRRIRLRRAAAPGAAADHVGPAEPAAGARAAHGGARHHGVRRRPRALGAPGEGRDGDLPQQDDPVRLLHDRARRGGARRVDPYHLLFQGGQFYLLGYSHEREAVRVFRLSRIRGKVSYATKAEHDFRRPADFDPRAYASPRRLAAGRGARRRGDPALRADRLAGRTPLRPLRGDPRRPRAARRCS